MEVNGHQRFTLVQNSVRFAHVLRVGESLASEDVGDGFMPSLTIFGVLARAC